MTGTQPAASTSTSSALGAPPSSPGAPPATIDAGRLIDRLAIMAEIGRTEAGGVTRLAWSTADVTARSLVGRWLARDAAADVRVDPAGNLIAEVAGSSPDLAPIVLGSHLDTVVEGGPLDGTYGVVAATEVAVTLAQRDIRLRHPLRIVAFANEEGVVGTPFTGSLAITAGAQRIDVGEIGPDGSRLADRIRAGGGDPDDLEAAAWKTRVAAYLELHIEQGPVLERTGVPIGVVTAITARRRAQIVVRGRANHAGTTPMDLRQDAVVGAARAVLAVEAVAREGFTEVATVGTVAVRPGNTNVIAGLVTLTVDIRSVDDGRLDRALAELDLRLADAATTTGTTITLTADAGSAAAKCSPLLMQSITEAAMAAGLSTVELPSGAGHDAQHMTEIGPVGMIFVPSTDGLSHNPGERTEPADLIRGAEVLLGSVLRIDEL